MSAKLLAQTGFEKPEHGFISDWPASNWEQALVSGNGTMGVLVFGKPYSETIILNHTYLYLPLAVSGTYVNQLERLPEIQSLLLAGKNREAGDICKQMRDKVGYTDKRDPYIPGCQLQIEQPSCVLFRYNRSVNFETGETYVNWEDEKGTFRRTTFVSRADSLVITRIIGTGKINCSINFEVLPSVNYSEKQIVRNGFKEIKNGVSDGFLYYRAAYKNSNPSAPFEGYEGVGRVLQKGGKLTFTNEQAIVENADEVLILTKLEPVKKYNNSQILPLEKSLASKGVDFQKLLSRHVVLHAALFNAVKLNLNAKADDRNLSSESLITKSHSAKVPLAMIEQAFDAGRYNIISSTGSNPPNLIGLWSGQWDSPWQGSFTTDGNLETALAFILPGNTPSLMKGFFDYNERMMDGFRRNAKELYGCRGIHVPAQLTTTPLETDFNPNWPLIYWTGGAGWLSSFYFDYYQYTGDKKFLEQKGYPFMKDAALFLEDFLKIKKDNKYVFVPSYSPENAPSNHPESPAVVNATMDVMITKQLLRNCIKVATILKTDLPKVKKWEEILAHLPDYKISKQGDLNEWLWSGEQNNNEHRHVSHLYALYEDLPIEFKNDSMRNAVSKTIELKFNYHKNKGKGYMAFGISHLGFAAAHIGNVEQSNEIINFLAKNYWSSGMASFHNMNELFNMDISGGFPYLVSQALVYSEPGYLKLIPALPSGWKEGDIEGIRLRGNAQIKKLSWSGKNLKVILNSPISQKIEIELPSNIISINEGTMNKSSKKSFAVNLIADKDIQLNVSIE